MGNSGMRANHLKEWLTEASKKEKKEAASEQTTAAEGITEIPDGTGDRGEGERRGKTPAEASN